MFPRNLSELLEWLGVGYLLVDRTTGEARYQLAGGLSGGSTAEPPADAQLEFGLALWPPSQFPVNPDPTAVVAIRKIEGFDGEAGIVGSEAGVDIRVEAVDHRGTRSRASRFGFSSVAGLGSLIDAEGGARQIC